MKDKILNNINIQIMLMIFAFGGIFGFLYEELFYRIDLGYFVKRGTTFGPWIPIYGFGAVLIVLLTNRFKKKAVFVFLLSGCISGILEYVTGYLLLAVRGERLWDYRVEIWNWGNINGFICLRSVLFFAVSGVFLQYVVHPVFGWISQRCRKKIQRLLTETPAFLFAGDIVLSLLVKII